MKTYYVLLLILPITTIIYSQSGNLDTSFGNDGIVITNVSNNEDDGGNSVIVTSDNKIIVTGYSTSGIDNDDFALVKYNQDGSLDTSFGNGGIQTMDFNGTNDVASSSILQSDGKIITVGYTTNSNRDIAISRFNSDGSLDISFANNGKYVYDNGFDDDKAVSIAILSNNNIIVGCETTSATLETDYAVLKLDEAGNLDTSFGDNGIIITDVGNNDYIEDIKLQADNKIIIVGTSHKDDAGDGDNSDKAVVRYTLDGSLDPTFNVTGIVLASFENGGRDILESIIIESDGKIIVSGSSNLPLQPDGHYAMSRYNMDGSIDLTFGNNGTTITDFGPTYDYCNSSLIQDDGKIILGGYNLDITTFESVFSLARYDANGDLDPTFGTNGLVTIDLTNNDNDFGASLAFHSNNKLLFAGTSGGNGNPYDFVLARFQIDGNLEIDDFISNSKKFSVYPNPTSESIFIISQTKNDELVKIEVYSINGKKIKTVNNYNSELGQPISLKNVASGIYLLKISNDKISETIKLIKK